MPRRQRIRKSRSTLEVAVLETPLGPLVRLSVDNRPVVLTTPNEARSLGYWLLEASNEADQTSDAGGGETT